MLSRFIGQKIYSLIGRVPSEFHKYQFRFQLEKLFSKVHIEYPFHIRRYRYCKWSHIYSCVTHYTKRETISYTTLESVYQKKFYTPCPFQVIYLNFPLLFSYKFFDESSMSSSTFLINVYRTKDDLDIKMNVITFYCLASKCDAIYFYVFYLYCKRV